MRISELENKLRKHAETTKSAMHPPFDLNEEIKNMEGQSMTKPKRIMKRTAAIAAVLALCIITVTMSPLASSIKGFFKDIVRFDGAITGTQYENATNEIKVDVLELTSENGNIIIPLDLTFENPNEAPFAYIQEIAVADYMILDSKTGEILKLESYPEYYGNTNGKQVCYSNANMRAAMIESMKKYIASFTEAKYIMIGHEDNADMCTCKNCLDERARYGNYAGQELHFTNLVAEELNKWMAINYPDRSMEYVFFAYQTTQDPPIKTEMVNGEKVPVYDENGRYLPFNDDFKIVDNVRVFYAPIDADFSKPITQESNVTHYEQLRGWGDLFNYSGHEGE